MNWLILTVILTSLIVAKPLHQGWSGVGVAEDRYVGGNSITTIIDTSHTLTFRVQIKPSETFPFAGVKIPINPSNPNSAQGVDLSKSTGLWIRIQTSSATQARVILKSIAPGNTNPQDPVSFRFYEIEIPALGKDTMLRWQDFQIPAWWATSRSIPMHERLGISIEDLKHAAWIEILSGFSPNGLDSATMVIQRLEIHPKSNSADQPKALSLWWLIPFIGFCTVAIAGILLWRSIYKKNFTDFHSIPKQKHGQASTMVFPQPMEIPSALDQDAQRVQQWLSEHYMNPDLSLEDLIQNLKMNPHRIATVFKDAIKSPFKSYLAELRLTEAARQLQNPDLSVQDVAFAVGYNHVAHFNRQFKERFGKTPSEFRKPD